MILRKPASGTGRLFKIALQIYKCQYIVFHSFSLLPAVAVLTSQRALLKRNLAVTIVYPVRTAASQAAKTGSNPVGDASFSENAAQFADWFAVCIFSGA